MRMRSLFLALATALALAGAARGEALDLKRYMPLSELAPGMTGVGKTTLDGATIVEFQVKVLAILKNVGPKRDLIIIRCSGAGLEESGVVAGMSGSPVYVGGRLIGAVAYAFSWCKAPIGGVQPIEQMLRVTDEFPWSRPGARQASRPAATYETADPLAVALPLPPRDESFTVPVSALGLADPSALAALSGRDACDMQPILTPVMVSGLSSRALERLRGALAPFGMMPMQGGGAVDPKLAPAAKLEPGAPLAVALSRGDVQITTMGTITEIAGDRLYGFGHSMFGLGEADYPLMTGIAHVVIPSLMRSTRLGAPVREVGHLVWDEQTAVFGRLGDQRAGMIPVTLKVVGPGKTPERTYRAQIVRNRMLSSLLAGTVAGNCLTVQSDLPRDHTVAYRVTVKPAGRPPIVRENLTVSPNGDAYVESQVRNVVGLLMENPFENLTVESVDVQATVEPVSRMAEIQEVRPLRNAVRPGDTVPVEVKVRPWRAEPVWLTVEVRVPEDYPEGTCRLTLCGADEALRQEMREAPARFRPDDVESLLATLKRDERRDQLLVRIEAPGEGIAVGRDELPNLPATMRTVLTESARRQVTTVKGALVTRRPTEYVLTGTRGIEFTVDRKAPQR